MIRPFTCLAFLLACGSGLYLYQSKHRAALLDEQIGQTVKSTDVLREQTRMLSAEWTLLNDPERLRQLATQFLTLQTVSPNQFTSLADLDSRLPAPVPPGTPAAQGQVPVAADDTGRSGADEGKPGEAKIAEAPATVTPKDAAVPATRTAASSGAAPVSTRVAMAVPGEPQHAAEARAPTPRAAPPPPRSTASEHRPAEPRGPLPLLAEARPLAPAPRMPIAAPVANYGGGSLLGMAHGTASPPAPIPLPRPMPVSAPAWSYTNGG